MNNGVLVCSPKSLYKNVGDYIQSVAQEQFLDKIDCYVERETLNEFHSGERTNVIMNGWFTRNPQTFPPSSDINPLFVSFHLVPKIAEQVLRDDTIPYFKKYQPIGARDKSTMEILKTHGIDSYFSGCLTLTLGNTYKKERTGGVIFVDPYYPIAGMKLTLYNPIGYIRSLWYLIKNFKKSLKLSPKFAVESRTIFRSLSITFERIYSAANFYEYYKKSFTDDLILNAEYITHNVSTSSYYHNDEWMALARNLIQKYADASLVVTSRIHCGLPCLGVETPCIFVMSDALMSGSLRSGGRFGGLQELFHIARWTKDGIRGMTEDMKVLFANGKLDNPSAVSVKREYRSLRDKLNETVRNWVSANK